MMAGLGCFANFFLYQAFMTGSYNYRNTEVVRMRRVPLPVKLAVSTSLSTYMVFLLYNDHLYNEDLYRVSLKYRLQFDDQYSEFLEGQKIENSGFIV